MTQEEAQQAGLDAGDLNMHRAGRKEWNYADKAVAEATFKRLWSVPIPAPPIVEEESGADILTTFVAAEVAEAVFDDPSTDTSNSDSSGVQSDTTSSDSGFSGFDGGSSGGGGADF